MKYIFIVGIGVAVLFILLAYIYNYAQENERLKTENAIKNYTIERMKKNQLFYENYNGENNKIDKKKEKTKEQINEAKEIKSVAVIIDNLIYYFNFGMRKPSGQDSTTSTKG